VLLFAKGLDADMPDRWISRLLQHLLEKMLQALLASSFLQWGGPCGGDVIRGAGSGMVVTIRVDPGPDTCPRYPSFYYTDPEDGCTLIVNWKGFATDDGSCEPCFQD
jgi:hypothetical protein